MKNGIRKVTITAIGALVATALLSCGKESELPTKPIGRNGGLLLTVASGVGPGAMAPLLKEFNDSAMIEVRAHYDRSDILGTAILQQGANANFDVFIAERPAYLAALSSSLAPLPPELLAKVPDWARSPDGKWVGIAARMFSITYNTTKVKPSDLPSKIADVANPKWRGKIGWAPADPAFVEFFASMIDQSGEFEAKKWLKSFLADSPVFYPSCDVAVLAAAAGDVDWVLSSNDYTAFILASESTKSSPIAVHHFAPGDPGNHVSLTAVARLDKAPYPPEAEKFVNFLLTPYAQSQIEKVGYQFPVASRGSELSKSGRPAVSLEALSKAHGIIAGL